MTKQVYIFSGLGADERVFKRMTFEGMEVHFIQWQIPFEQEDMAAYAKRISQQILSLNPILIGLSFGGIVATEIAKIIPTEKLILIASVKSKFEIPWYYRCLGKLRLHKLMPPSLLKKSNFAIEWLFGTSSTVEKKLLKQILIDTDGYFLKWAIDRIVFWKNDSTPHNVIHIHGTHDKVIPIKFVKCHYRIKKGGHFMTLYQAKEISALLQTIIF